MATSWKGSRTDEFGDLGVEQLAAQRLEPVERAFLVLAHETAVTDHICSQNCRKPSLNAFFSNDASQSRVIREVLCVGGR